MRVYRPRVRHDLVALCTAIVIRVAFYGVYAVAFDALHEKRVMVLVDGWIGAQQPHAAIGGFVQQQSMRLCPGPNMRTAGRVLAGYPARYDFERGSGLYDSGVVPA